MDGWDWVDGVGQKGNYMISRCFFVSLLSNIRVLFTVKEKITVEGLTMLEFRESLFSFEIRGGVSMCLIM